MKPFVRNLLAVMAGTAIMWVIGFLLFTFFLGGLIAAFSQEPQMPSSSVLVVDLSTIHLDEQTTDIPDMDLLTGSMGLTTVGLWDAVDAITTAATDPAVTCLYLKPDGGDAGAASMEELRAAVRLFHQSGKPVISQIQNPTAGSLYLATAADKVFMTSDHGSTSQVTGVAAQLIFLKDLLEKLGVNVQLIRHGKYKSAGEMYVRSASSPENREQNRALVVSMWNTLAGGISESRGVSVAALDSLVNNLSLNFPEDFLSNGLVDELADKEGVSQYLCKMAGASGPDKLNLVALSDYIGIRPLSEKRSGWRVAVVFVNGEIVDQPSSGILSGDQYADMLTSLRYDDSVKAVVLRVNSPGGSVLASSKIRDAVDQLGKVKPVVASYGDYAASGGYWISSGCQAIYSDAATITGSIGVFSMIPDFSKTAKDKLHVGIETVGSHAHSDIYSMMRPLDAKELAYMQASVEDIYERFVGLVADGRNLSTEFVDSIAQGRVWTGSDALEIGLVDQIGTLQDAVYQAVTLSGGPEDFQSWQVVQYPSKSTLENMLQLLFQKSYQQPTVFLENTPFAGLSSAFEDLRLKDPTRVYARLPYAIEVK